MGIVRVCCCAPPPARSPIVQQALREHVPLGNHRNQTAYGLHFGHLPRLCLRRPLPAAHNHDLASKQRHDTPARPQIAPFFAALLKNIRHRRSRVLGRAILCSNLAEQRHGIIRKAVALTGNEGEIAVASNEELHAARISGKQLLALWNALPDIEKRRKVGDRKALIDQLWSAIELLPDPEPQSDAKRRSKQDAVIAMLRRPEGATVDEVASTTGWQRHTVRGVFSGTLKKKLGLILASAQEERGRVYRIAEPASV